MWQLGLDFPSDCASRVAVGPSLIEGAGDALFAYKDILSKNNEVETLICVYALAKDATSELSGDGKFAVEIGGKVWDGLKRLSYGRQANDGFDDASYNAKFKIVGDQLCLVAIRDIIKGEEILVPYGVDY